MLGLDASCDSGYEKFPQKMYGEFSGLLGTMHDYELVGDNDTVMLEAIRDWNQYGPFYRRNCSALGRSGPCYKVVIQTCIKGIENAYEEAKVNESGELWQEKLEVIQLYARLIQMAADQAQSQFYISSKNLEFATVYDFSAARPPIVTVADLQIPQQIKVLRRFLHTATQREFGAARRQMALIGLVAMGNLLENGITYYGAAEVGSFYGPAEFISNYGSVLFDPTIQPRSVVRRIFTNLYPGTPVPDFCCQNTKSLKKRPGESRPVEGRKPSGR